MDLDWPEFDFLRGTVAEWAKTTLARLRAEDGAEGLPNTLPVRWRQALYDDGWAVPTWPVDYGGRGLSVLEATAVAEEFAAAGAPLTRATGGELLVGPTILQFGTPEQKQRFLPPIAAGAERWCQGFSEPQAGSDLAAVATTAVRDGDEFIINGHKIWTSEADEADFMFLLAITDPTVRSHVGMTYFLLPMDQPGIEVRPIVQPDGRVGFTEVLLRDARCPAANVVGEIGEGWSVAMGTLGFERGVSSSASHHRFRAELEELISRARTLGRLADPFIRDRIVSAWCDVELLELASYRLLTAALHGDVDPGAAIVGGTYKFAYTEFHQRLTVLALDIEGPAGALLTGPQNAPPPPGVGMGSRKHVYDYPVTNTQSNYLFARSGTIYGGTSQVQRNIVAERLLGLPREPRGN
ncbi:MAG: putative acyl-CoA dehydrogenase [Mycobacterium sp.]|jgi:alkylation response protein AidB-like acyl-CoA dehydrogenase|nr:putative acyl-CoA dehydrogenase [Mycobacterium sp.]